MFSATLKSPANVDTPVTLNDSRVPRLVKDELTTADPRVVALNVSTLFTLYTLPVAMFICSEDPKLSPVASNWNVLLPSPDTIVIPPPSAAASFAAPDPNSRFLSSTDTVVELSWWLSRQLEDYL